jgi:hypothetical protein
MQDKIIEIIRRQNFSYISIFSNTGELYCQQFFTINIFLLIFSCQTPSYISIFLMLELSFISISVKLLILKSLRILFYLNNGLSSSRELEDKGGEGFYIA